MKKSHVVIALIVLGCLLLPVTTEAQCAMCKASVESSINDPSFVAKGINKGIVYLMIVPYLLLAFIFRKQIVSLWKQYVRKSKV